jgi:hypothetical protein
MKGYPDDYTTPTDPLGGLFAALAPDPASPSATEVGLSALGRSAASNEGIIAALVPLARELAKQVDLNHGDGITVTNLRRYAMRRGLFDGTETNLHFLGTVMKRAGLVSTGKTRRSDMGVTHGKIQVVWRWPGGPL